MNRAIGTRGVLTSAAACWLALAGCEPNRQSRPLDLSKHPGPFTILCGTFAGPTRNADVRSHLEALEARGMHDGYTVETPGGTLLCYGNYEKHDSPEAAGHLDALRRFIYGDTRQKAFPAAMMVPVSKPPEEYFPLADAPAGMFYSLQIAAFYGPQSEGRTYQENAVMLARELREKNDLEAYVHSDATCSIVCVGAFPPSAIVTKRRLPSIIADPRAMIRGEVSAEDIAKLTKVVDPTAIALQQQFPRMLYNGAERWTWLHTKLSETDWIQGTTKYYHPSQFVEIPNRKVDQYGQVVIERITQ